MTWWRAMTWPDSHTPRVVGCWTGVGFVHYKAESGTWAPQRPEGLHPWEPSEPQPHRENPRIFPKSRTLKGAAAPSQWKAMWGVNSYQPGQTLQDSTILSSSTAGVCLIWAWLSWVPWKWIKNYTTFQLSLDLIIVRIFNAVLLFWLDYLSYFIPRKIL